MVVHLTDICQLVIWWVCFDEEKDQRYAGSFRNLWIMNNEKGKGKYTAMTDTAIYIIKGEATKAQRAWAENRYQLFDRNDVYNADGSTKNMKQYLELSKICRSYSCVKR